MAGNGLTCRISIAIQNLIDREAGEAGVSDRGDLDDTVRALPSPHRRKLILGLEALKSFSDDPADQAQVQAVLIRIARVWAAQPYDPAVHTIEDHGARRLIDDAMGTQPEKPAAGGRS